MSNLFANIKAHVANKTAAKPVTPKKVAALYSESLEASSGVKSEANRLMEQALVTDKAVKGNLQKAEDRKQSEANDQNALNKLMTDLEVVATEVIVNQEKTKELHLEASLLEESNKEVRDQLSSVSFSTLIAATKAAKTNTVKGV